MRRADNTSTVTGLALAILAGGCQQAPGGDATESKALTEVAGAKPGPAEARPSAKDASAPRPRQAAAAGVPLPPAKPAPSALFNAAYQRVENDWEQIIYLCDGVRGDRVTLVTMPNAKGLSELWTYRKPDFRTVRETVRLGDEDPGAGQVMRELRHPDGSAFGSVHSVNPGILGDADATALPMLRSTTNKNKTTQCRWLPRARVLLVNPKRSVAVIAEADGSYTYQSFDYAQPGKVLDGGEGRATSTPTVTVRNGRLVPSEPGREVYEFSAGPWTYRVSASADNQAPGATLTVLCGGKPVSTSVAAAYQMAARRIE